jgi:YegS/Rv2252/BmrU family lipid kinase
MTPGPREAGFGAVRPKRRALMLVNRTGTRSRSCLDDGLRILAGSGIEAEPELLRTPERIPDLIRERAVDCELVILGGGDGTLSHALDALLVARRPLGILPMGNANDLARTLGIPTDCAGACRVIAEGRRRRIDVGWVNGTHFFNVASMGLSVRIARRLTRDRKQRWGVLAYLGCAWEAVHEQRSFWARVVCDRLATELHSMQITVGNGRYFGGGMTVVDDAAIDDGRLDLYALPPLRWWRLLVLLPILRWGLHRPIESILSLHGREIEVETDRPLDINVDGEVRTHTPARFRVLPRAMEVFVPATSTPDRDGA